MLNEENVCLSCFRERTADDTVCPYCNYETGKESDTGVYLPIGSRIAERYIVGKVLGQGGFGITYLAYDKIDNIKNAIKEFFPAAIAFRNSSDCTVTPHNKEKEEIFAAVLEKFIQETKVLSSIQHRNIMPVLNLCFDNNTAYMVMPYFEGVTLKEYAQTYTESRMDIVDALNIMMPVLDGLEAIHQKGFIHRDISPDNIYITKERTIKLLDFGAARQALGAESKSLTVILKHGYAPPEQYTSRGRQGAWTDIYAAAATLLTLMTGKTLPSATDRSMGAENLVMPSHLGLDINQALEHVLYKALSIDIGARYASVAEFKAAIGRACGGSSRVLLPTGDYTRKPDTKVKAVLLADTKSRIIAEPKYQGKKQYLLILLILLLMFGVYQGAMWISLHSIWFSYSRVILCEYWQGHFEKELAWIKKDGKYGYIDKSGNIVVKPQLDSLLTLDDFSTSAGLARAKINGKWGFIDKKGNLVIEPQFDWAYPFKAGVAVVGVDGNRAYVDKNGNIEIYPSYEEKKKLPEAGILKDILPHLAEGTAVGQPKVPEELASQLDVNPENVKKMLDEVTGGNIDVLLQEVLGGNNKKEQQR